MTNTFDSSPVYLLTSESVTEGHPDKICDQISDAVLDTILGKDPYGRVACETAVTNGIIIVMGERNRQGHEFRCLVAGEADHHSLVAGARLVEVVGGGGCLCLQ